MTERSPIVLPSRTGFCWLATIATGGPLIAVAVAQVAATPRIGMLPALLTTAALVLVLEMLPVQVKLRHHAGVIVVSSAFVYALMFVWGPWAAIAVRTVGSAATDVRVKKPWFKIFFNAALYALTALGGYVVLAWHGMSASLAEPATALVAGDLPWIALSWVAWFAVNEIVLAGVVPGKLAQLAAAPMDFVRDSLLNLGVLAMAPLAIVTAIGHWFLTPMLLIPLLLLRWTGQVARDREHDAAHDALTGLPNRLALKLTLDQAFAKSRRGSDRFALMLIDLDDFKSVNDRLGHQAGDALLVQVADRLRRSVRPEDCVARLGGDEFAVVACDVDVDRARVVAQNIGAAFTEPVRLDGATLSVGFSLGIAMFPDHGLDARTLMSRADQAMYRAKRQKVTVDVAGDAARDDDGPQVHLASA